MKNIHLIPTDNPSNLVLIGKTLVLKSGLITNGDRIQKQHIYITSSSEGELGDYVIEDIGGTVYGPIDRESIVDNPRKIILTTDQDLIKDGVQAIDNEFLEWFVKNPSCEKVEVIKQELNTDYRSNWKQKFYYKIIIPKEEPRTRVFGTKNDKQFWSDKPVQEGKPKQETLEEVAENQLRKQNWDTTITLPFNSGYIKGFQQGAEWQQERVYSEEDMRECWKAAYEESFNKWIKQKPKTTFKKWFKQFRKK